MRSRLKRRAAALLARAGWRVGRIDRSLAPEQRRPVGELTTFLEGLRARGFAPRQVLDVGAHRGAWSRAVHTVFPAARFLLVEPQREWGPRLERLCAAAPGSEWIAAAAADSCGEAVLAVDPSGGGSSLLPGAEGAAASGQEARTVTTVTLDSLFADGARPLPELVKLDVEGAELSALSAAASLFGAAELFVLEAAMFRYRPQQAIFSELVAFMAERGYEPYDFPWFLRRPFDGALGLADVAFARADGPLRAEARWG